MTSSEQAERRSGSGPRAAQWLSAPPTTRETTMKPDTFQVAFRRRLRLRLLLGSYRCPGSTCGRLLDVLGDHLTSCPCTGGPQRRAKPLERAWQRVFREAGGRVVPQPMLRDLDLGVRPLDTRRVDLIARGLPLYGGILVCGDASLVAPLTPLTPWRRHPVSTGRHARRRGDRARPPAPRGQIPGAPVRGPRTAGRPGHGDGGPLGIGGSYNSEEPG